MWCGVVVGFVPYSTSLPLIVDNNNNSYHLVLYMTQQLLRNNEVTMGTIDSVKVSSCSVVLG